MNSIDILTRTGLASGLIFAGLGIYFIYNWMLSRRATRGLVTDLGVHRPGSFLIVYFSTPTCAPCKTVQRPALEGVQQLMGNALKVLEIDASQEPELANRWGVLSAPTTYIIDPRGKVKHINHGVARAEKLLMQIHS